MLKWKQNVRHKTNIKYVSSNISRTSVTVKKKEMYVKCVMKCETKKRHNGFSFLYLIYYIIFYLISYILYMIIYLIYNLTVYKTLYIKSCEYVCNVFLFFEQFLSYLWSVYLRIEWEIFYHNSISQNKFQIQKFSRSFIFFN